MQNPSQCLVGGVSETCHVVTTSSRVRFRDIHVDVQFYHKRLCNDGVRRRHFETSTSKELEFCYKWLAIRSSPDIGSVYATPLTHRVYAGIMGQ